MLSCCVALDTQLLSADKPVPFPTALHCTSLSSPRLCCLALCDLPLLVGTEAAKAILKAEAMIRELVAAHHSICVYV